MFDQDTWQCGALPQIEVKAASIHRVEVVIWTCDDTDAPVPPVHFDVEPTLARRLAAALTSAADRCADRAAQMQADADRLEF